MPVTARKPQINLREELTQLSGKAGKDHKHLLSDVTDAGTAAAANLGTAPEEVPTNADLAAIAQSGDSADASYNNTASGRTATDAQAAIDEAFTEIDRAELIQTVDDQATINAKFFTGRYSLDDGDRTDSNAATDLFTIATNSPKWVQGPDGLLREVPAGSVAREWRDGVCQGAVVEPQSTRINLYPTQFGNPYWIKVGATVAENIVIAPNGSTSLDKLVEDLSTGQHRLNFTETVSAGKQYVFSVFLEPAGRENITFSLFTGFPAAAGIINLQTLEVVIDTGVFSDYGAERLKNGTIRFWFSSVASVSGFNTVGYVGMAPVFSYASRSYTGDGTSGVYVWGAQIEQGLKPTSLILGDETAAVTRLADSITRTTGAEFNADEGTFVIEGEYIAGDTILSAGDYDVVAEAGKSKYAIGYEPSDFPELVTNGDFSDGLTGWTNSSNGTGTAILVSGAVVLNGTTSADRGRIEQPISLNTGSVYKVALNASSVSGTVAIKIDSTNDPISADIILVNGVNSFIFSATATDTLLTIWTASGGGSATVDNISVKEVAPESPITIGNGTHKSIKYLPRKLSADELTELEA